METEPSTVVEIKKEEGEEENTEVVNDKIQEPASDDKDSLPTGMS